MSKEIECKEIECKETELKESPTPELLGQNQKLENAIGQVCNGGHVRTRRGERSFSLLETIIAVSLVAVLMVEVSGVHGNAISFNQYGRKVLQGTYLAKRIMAQVEYNASIRTPIKDMAAKEKDKPFEDAPEFSYSLSIEPLPHALDLMFKVIAGSAMGEGDSKKDDSSGPGAMLEQIKGLIEQSVGDEPIWIAKVEVNWPEGARRGSTQLAMIVTDTKKIEESVGKLLDAAPAPAGAAPPVGGAGAVPPAPPLTPPVNPDENPGAAP